MMRQEFDRRRKYMVQRLQAIEDVSCPEPLGAFYTFPQVSAYYGRSFDGPPIEARSISAARCSSRPSWR